MAESTTPDPTLDGPTALRLLREVVAERPDYVYKSPEGATATCVYTYQGKPSCLVAHVLVRAGFDIKRIEELDGGGTIGTAAEEADLPLPPDVVDILYAAQLPQDSRQPWREALAAAEEAARTLAVSA